MCVHTNGFSTASLKGGRQVSLAIYIRKIAFCHVEASNAT